MPDGVFATAANLIALGGPVVAILIGLSIVALALILLKVYQFAVLKVGSHWSAGEALALWSSDRRREAAERLTGSRSPVAEVLSVTMRLAAHDSVPKQVMEDEAGRVAQERLYRLRRGFRALEAIAQIAPLLGLFGTVLGMIEAFRTLQSAGNAVDPSVLAGGIWVALLTTAVGLAVAMPVSLVLTWFESRVEGERVAIETMSTRLLSEWQMLHLAQEPEPQSRIVRFTEHSGHAH